MLDETVKQQLLDIVTDYSLYDRGLGNDHEQQYVPVDSGVLAQVSTSTYGLPKTDLYKVVLLVFIHASNEETRNKYATAIRDFYLDELSLQKEDDIVDEVNGEFRLAITPDKIDSARDELVKTTLSIGDVTKDCLVSEDVVNDQTEREKYFEDITKKLSTIEKQSLLLQGLEPTLEEP